MEVKLIILATLASFIPCPLIAQDLPLPLPLTAIDDTLFAPLEIQRIGIRKVDITEIKYDLTNPEIGIDTLLKESIVFDDLGRQVTYKSVGQDYNKRDFYYTYSDSITVLKIIGYNPSLSAKYPSRPDSIETVRIYLNDQMISSRVAGHFKDGKKPSLVQFDTVFYRNGLLQEVLSRYYDKQGAFLDTASSKYQYDEKGRLISKNRYSKYIFEYITWQFILSTNQVYFSIYNYDNDLWTESRYSVHFKIDAPPDTFKLYIYSRKELVESPNTRIYKFIDDKSDDYYFSSTHSDKMTRTEYLYGEVKRTEYKPGTQLPSKIWVWSGDFIYLYCFEYISN